MKKAFVWLLALTLLLGCCPAISLQAKAATEGYYTYEVSGGEATITDCAESASGDIIIPDTLGGCPVTKIDEWAFSGCGIESAVIPDSVLVIGKAAFSGCYKLTSVTIGKNVTTVSDQAFYSTSLVSVEFPDSVTSIGAFAFDLCYSLTTVYIGRGLTTVGNYAFNGFRITDVYYNGTEAQWEQIEIGTGNDPLTNATIHFLGTDSPAPGDVDGSGSVNEDDAIYLLQAVLMPNLFPITQDVDFDGNGEVNEDDAIYLLQHVLMPEMFPLTPAPEEPETGDVMTYAQYMAAELGTPVTVECYVQAHQSWWEDTICVYAQDRDGGYFLYNMACSEEDAERLTPGTKIRVSGYKEEWCGQIEILEGSFEFVEGADTFVAEPLDVTALVGTEELRQHHNKKICVEGLRVVKVEFQSEDSSGDIYITTEKNGVTFEIMIEQYLTEPETEVYQTAANLQEGQLISIEGFLYWYEGPNPHVTGITLG